MPAANDNYELVSLHDAAKMTSLSRSMLNRYRAEGSFPAAITMGERKIAFIRTEVQGWISNKIAESRRAA
jgi:prophage regulatory protein